MNLKRLAELKSKMENTSAIRDNHAFVSSQFSSLHFVINLSAQEFEEMSTNDEAEYGKLS